MSELAPGVVWPDDSLAALILVVVVCLAILFDRGRMAAERLTVTVGAIRVGAPTLVALPAAETSTAVGLLGGAIADYLAESGREQSR